MYDPRTGRFLQEDPIGFESGDANPYRYVLNQPTTDTDPSGLKVKIDGKAADKAKLVADARADHPKWPALTKSIAEALFDNPFTFDYKSEKQFLNDVTMRLGIINSAELLAKNKHGFIDVKRALVWVSKDSEYWKNLAIAGKTGDVYGITLVDPSKPLKGLQEIAGKPSDPDKPWLKLDCATSYKLSQYSVYILIVGEEQFKKDYPKLIIFGGIDPNNPAGPLNNLPQKRPPIPGDLVRFSNPDGVVGFTGENAVYVGKVKGVDLVIAFPYSVGAFPSSKDDETKTGYATVPEILDWLNDNRVKGATKKAKFLEDEPMYMDYTKLPWK